MMLTVTDDAVLLSVYSDYKSVLLSLVTILIV